MNFRKTIPAIMLTLCLAACTNQTTENVQTNMTTAVSSKTILTEETTTVMNVEIACTLYEPEDSEKSDRTYVELSDNTPFFSCEYKQTGLVSAETFSDKALIEMAQNALLSSEVTQSFTMMSKSVSPIKNLP